MPWSQVGSFILFHSINIIVLSAALSLFSNMPLKVLPGMPPNVYLKALLAPG